MSNMDARIWLMLVTLFAAVYFLSASSSDVVWYVSSNGSSNVTTCGRTEVEPCDSLQTLLSLNPVDTSRCYQPQNDSAAVSTTVYFLRGSNVVLPICLGNWTNLSIVGREGAIIVSTKFIGAVDSIVEFKSCTNVSVENLTFEAGLAYGKSILTFLHTTHLRISRCSVTGLGSGEGISLFGSSGDIVIDSTLFLGGVNPLNVSHIPAVTVAQGVSSLSSNRFQLLISNCSFQDISGAGQYEDSYQQLYQDAVGLRLRFDANTTGNVVTVQNSLFTRLRSTVSNVVGVDFDTSSSGNLVQFIGCEFRDNTARYGGGVSAYFWFNSSNNALLVQGCNFTNNTATLEGGGVLGVFISEQVDNRLEIQSSTFIRNTATYGAGVFILNNPAWYDYAGATYNITPALVSVNVSNCTFINNVAPLCEGIVSVLRVLLYINGRSTFTGNTGSGVLLRLSYAHFSDVITFEGNMAENGAAIQILDQSRVDLSNIEVGNTWNNAALISGGAIFADDSSSSVPAIEYTHKVADDVSGPCFLQFGDEFTIVKPNISRFIFDNNTALSGGQSIQAYSLRSCFLYNFVPAQLSTFFSFGGDGTVQYVNTPVLGTTSTGPSFVYFYGASTRCYKPVGNITYLMPNCSNQLLNQTFYSNPNLQCGIQRSASVPRAGPGVGLGPTTDRLFLPWSGIVGSWSSDTIWTQCPEPEPAQLVLSPAPGEMFDLTILVLDQLLMYTSANAYLQVSNTTTPSAVLLQLNGFQYSYMDRVLFTPNQPLIGLALVGLPGTKGWLHVVVESQIEGQNIDLLLPFQLAQCPSGYYDPPGASTVDEVNSLIADSYSTTQRIPDGQPLACQCFSSLRENFKSVVFNFPVECIQGYTVELSGALWAGFLPTDNSSSSLRPPTVACPAIPINATPFQDSQTRLMLAQKQSNMDPVDVVSYASGIVPGGGAPVTCFEGYTVEDIINYRPKGPFAVEYCFSSYCQGNSLSTWYLASVEGPCVENREGPLCGSCKPGYALTLYSTSCKDCSNAHIYAPILTTVTIGAVIVVLAVVFNLGLSPTFDSFLFFIQSILVVVGGRTGYTSFPVLLAFFNPDFTFNQCITPTLTALNRLLLQYITPLYILFLLMVVLALTSVKGLSKVLGRHSFLQALWLLFMISYFNIANTTFAIIHCTPVGPSNELVLVEDPSVVCYAGTHLAWSIVAIIVAIIFVVPLPLYVIILYRIPRYKPITDVYTSVYTDQRRWWVCLDLGRRLLLVLLGVFVQDSTGRNFALLMGLLVILLVLVVTWPYKSKVDNWFALFVTWMLLVITCVTQPNLYLIMDPNRYTSWALTSIVLLVGGVLLVVETLLGRFFKLTVDDLHERCILPCMANVRSYLTRMNRNGNATPLSGTHAANYSSL